MANWQRTHTCGDLRDTDVGKSVTLNGWVNTYRVYNDQIFIDLRDRYGITQVVFESGSPPFGPAQELRGEFVVSVRGKVRPRLPGKENLDHATGKVEVEVAELQILNRCPTPPFELAEITEGAKERHREKAKEKGKEVKE